MIMAIKAVSNSELLLLELLPKFSSKAFCLSLLGPENENKNENLNKLNKNKLTLWISTTISHDIKIWFLRISLVHLLPHYIK